VTAVVLALASAALFGGMTVAVRFGLARAGDAATGALATVLPAAAVVTASALVRHDVGRPWPFLLTGLLGPGLSQILFTLAVREIGASRTSVAVGAAPLVSVALALLFLDEPVRTPLLLGALAIVAGGILLAAERDRPGHLRARGLVYAGAAAVVFATRDNLVRALHAEASPETAAAATLLAATCVAALWARRLPPRGTMRAFVPAGLLFGLSYVCLFEAYWRARVSVVAPLVATESLFGVALSALLLRRAEGMGPRLALGALLVVAGGAVIGAYR
jgi:drug/metabolite transporter (DMT)-like permease